MLKLPMGWARAEPGCDRSEEEKAAKQAEGDRRRRWRSDYLAESHGLNSACFWDVAAVEERDLLASFEVAARVDFQECDWLECLGAKRTWKCWADREGSLEVGGGLCLSPRAA